GLRRRAPRATLHESNLAVLPSAAHLRRNLRAFPAGTPGANGGAGEGDPGESRLLQGLFGRSPHHVPRRKPLRPDLHGRDPAARCGHGELGVAIELPVFEPFPDGTRDHVLPGESQLWPADRLSSAVRPAIGWLCIRTRRILRGTPHHSFRGVRRLETGIEL